MKKLKRLLLLVLQLDIKKLLPKEVKEVFLNKQEQLLQNNLISLIIKMEDQKMLKNLLNSIKPKKQKQQKQRKQQMLKLQILNLKNHYMLKLKLHQLPKKNLQLLLMLLKKKLNQKLLRLKNLRLIKKLLKLQKNQLLMLLHLQS